MKSSTGSSVLSSALLVLSYSYIANGQCIGTPTTPCNAQFSERTCGSACDPRSCDGTLEFCEFACTQPGCSCDINIVGQCSFNPALDGSTNVACQGNPTSCNLLGSEASCNRVEGCTWTGPPGLPDDPGTCVGSGIVSCEQQFRSERCDPCPPSRECELDRFSCSSGCTHPGCFCSETPGICPSVVNLFSDNRDTVISCEGSPRPCSAITDFTSCGNAMNCVWVPTIPTPAPAANILPEGVCRGTPTVSSCTGLFTDFPYLACSGLPSTQYNQCLVQCQQVPGCVCVDDPGVCGSGNDEVGVLSCEGSPLTCSEIDNLNDCTAAGCRWDAFIGEEPTRSPTTDRCDISLGLTCKSSAGSDCSTILPPTDRKCATGSPIFTLWLEYTANGCNQDANQQGDASTCQDVGTITSTASVNILCVDTNNVGTRLNVQPELVPPGGRFSLARERVGALPANITCSIFDERKENVLQIVSFDSSGKIGSDLDLKDGFGSLQVMQCDSKTCLDLFTYSTSATNVGQADTVILRYNIDFLFKEAVDVIDQLSTEVLAPNTVAEATVTEQVDICDKGDNGGTANVRVSAGGTVTGSCDTSEPLDLPINPDCNLGVELDCAGAGSLARNLEGVDCRFFNRELETTCRCASGARELRFRYTGKRCAPNVAGSGFTCEDLASPNLADTADFVFRIGETTLYTQNGVKIGEDVVFTNNNEVLPNTFTILVVQPGTSQVVQRIQITTNCARSASGTVARLLRDFGSVNFSGYSCNNNRVHNCYVEVEYTVCAENDGLATRTLDEYTLELDYPREDPVLFDLLKNPTPNDRELLPGESYCIVHPSEIELCQGPGTHVAIASATLKDTCPDTSGSADFEEITFDLIADASPAPTRAPTLNIEPEVPTVPSPSAPIVPTIPSVPTVPRPPSAPAPTAPTPAGCGPKPVFAPSSACP